MELLRIRCLAGEKDTLSANLWELGTIGITESEQPDGSWMLDAFFDGRFDAAGLARYAPEWTGVDERDWSEAWKDAWTALPVGASWFLVPDWLDTAAPEGRVRLVVHARQASGSGYQPATQLALEALESVGVEGARFLDWGTGSGILASAAHLRGAASIVACDVDHAATVEARDNFAADGVRAMVFTGTGRSVAAGRFDVIAANMNAAALESCARPLLAAAAPGARLVLSGFKAARTGDILRTFDLPAVSELASGDWRCLILRAC